MCTLLCGDRDCVCPWVDRILQKERKKDWKIGIETVREREREKSTEDTEFENIAELRRCIERKKERQIGMLYVCERERAHKNVCWRLSLCVGPSVCVWLCLNLNLYVCVHMCTCASECPSVSACVCGEGYIRVCVCACVSE